MTSVDSTAKASIASVVSGLKQLADVDPRDLSGDALYVLFAAIEDAARRLDGLRAVVVAAVEADGRWAADGSRSLAAWLRRATQASPGRAHAQSRLARALRDHLPRTAEALRAGSISAEHAGLLVTHTTSSPDRLAGLSHEQVGEAFLVQQAEELDAADFARLLKRWAVAADPEAADRDWKDDVEKENLVLAKSLHGYHLQGWLSDAGGAALDAALRARGGVPAADDTRTPAQRRAAALVGLARLALDAGIAVPGAAIRPHLTVHVPYDTLERLAESQGGRGGPRVVGGPGEAAAPAGTRAERHATSAHAPVFSSASRAAPPTGPGSPSTPAASPPAGRTPAKSTGPLSWRGATLDGCKPVTPGPRPPATRPAPTLVIPGGPDPGSLTGAAPAELDDGTPISPALLSRLACDSELARVIFGPAGEILDSGRAKRLFTPGQRRAIIARDRRCQYPGCDAPPREGEIHHSIWWYAQYGQTRAQDGVLLCWFHHDHVHANAISIERVSASGPGDGSGVPGDGRGEGSRGEGSRGEGSRGEGSRGEGGGRGAAAGGVGGVGGVGTAPGEGWWQFRDRHGRILRRAPQRPRNASAA